MMAQTFHLRYATLSDIPEIAAIVAQGMANDESVLYQWPTYQSQDPSVVVRWWTRKVRTMLNSLDAWYMVAEVDSDWSFPEPSIAGDAHLEDQFKGPGGPGKREIVGIAGWRRFVGPEENPAQLRSWEKNRGIWAAVERHLQSWDAWYARLVRIDTGFDHAVADTRQAACAKATEPEVPIIPGRSLSTKSANRPHLELLSLLVSPKYQRRGIASQLVKWGQNCAKREGVPLTLRSTQAGLPVYERCGFEQIGTMRYIVEGSDGGEGKEAGPRTVYLAWLPWKG